MSTYSEVIGAVAEESGRTAAQVEEWMRSAGSERITPDCPSYERLLVLLYALDPLATPKERAHLLTCQFAGCHSIKDARRARELGPINP